MKISLFERSGEDQPILALVLVLVGVLTLGFQDSLIKLMSSDASFWQIQALRSIGNIAFTLVLAIIGGGLALLIPQNPKAVCLRSFLLICTMFCFFAGAPFLSLSQMGAGLYTYPLFVTILAGPLLDEKVGIWRISSLSAGLLGALLVFEPWHDDFSTVQLLPILAGLFYAANIITIRHACRHESPLALAFFVAVGFTICGGIGIALLSIFPLPVSIQTAMPFVAIGWPELTVGILALIIVTSILNLTGNICLGRAYQTAESSWLAPVDFSYLIFAAMWSKIVFDEWPSGLDVAGMILIAGAGAITAWRENVKGISAPKTAKVRSRTSRPL